jgi:nitrite reductase/ring-hydroxylating ferredoxin subunit/uncharacterized membrane protein
MIGQRVVSVFDRQRWLDPIGEWLAQIVHDFFDGLGPRSQEVQNVLYGDGIGHPLHVILNEVPLGAWTTAATLDALNTISGSEKMAVGADTAIGFGLLGAVAAFATGGVDWQHLTGRTRRIGLAHALLNTTGSILYVSSLIKRWRGNRGTGRMLGFIGLSAATVGAFLGGHLVFGLRVGVDHTAGQTFPSEFVPVIDDQELSEGRLHRVEVEGVPILVVRQEGQIFALAETCAHLGAPLADGELQERSVVCPWHRSRFDLASGRVIDGPAVHAQPCLETRVRDGWVEVRHVEVGS